MKIDSSNVAMTSDYFYSSVTVNTVESSQMYRETEVEAEKDKPKNSDKVSLSESAKSLFKNQAANSTSGVSISDPIKESFDAKIKLLEALLRALTNGKSKGFTIFDTMASKKTSSSTSIFSSGQSSGSSISLSGRWIKESQGTSYFSEFESTTFSSTGSVTTSDGRKIDFNINLEMTRSFMETTNVQWKEVQMMDPLVINLDTDIAGLSDQKFLFDIDSDGEKESISTLKKGSGFLAYDKNGNGIIDDGGELFGAKTGNGFEELRQFDMDGNGWIDENDAIFNKLKVWTKDEDGNDKLIGLGDAGVGTIYLGNVSTEFALKNDVGQTNGQIRNSGFYLKENGGAGTIQHVDLAV